MCSIELCHKLLWIEFCMDVQHFRFTKENKTGNLHWGPNDFASGKKNSLKDFLWKKCLVPTICRSRKINPVIYTVPHSVKTQTNGSLVTSQDKNWKQ